VVRIRPSRTWLAAVLLAAILGGWVLHDLLDTGKHDLRDFDSLGVARLETAMWRSYYDHRQVRLFGEMTAVLRRQFQLPFWKSVAAAFYAARAAIVFQKGHNRVEYLRALPDLTRYYSLIARASATSFDVPRVSALELEWWIVHRQRAAHSPGDLERALAELAGGIYQLPAERFAGHARSRTEAMLLRDDRAAAGMVTDRDWRRIGELLDNSWSSLHTAVAH
jgi:hypothetical protein